MLASTRLLAQSSLSVLAFLCATLAASAQSIGAGLQPEYVVVNGERTAAGPSAPDIQVNAAKAMEQINTVNTEDMLEYAPSLLVRKRHEGDVQDPIATRTSGVGASARNLILMDGVLISSPIGNNNSSASPHFGIVAPQDVSRIDVLYGPFAARYAGNSIGVTVNIATRMPDHFELYGDVVGTLEPFDKYATSSTAGSWQVSGGVGDRQGAFSWRLSANHLDDFAQPLGFATLTQPATTSTLGTPAFGSIAERSRSALPIAVVGATSIEHQIEDTDTLKLAYDLPNQWQLSYVASLFHQDDDAGARTYLHDGNGNPVYAGSVNLAGYNYTIPASTFSNTIYDYQQTQLAQALTLTSAPDGDFGWELIASDYNYLNDKQRTPTALLPGALAGGAGTVNRMNGTGWYTLDANAVWRSLAGHELSFGVHRDAETFAQRRNNLTDWIQGGLGSTVNSAQGRTFTNAQWVQDVWAVSPGLKLALGLRHEDWRAYDGTNASASPALNVTQPPVSSSSFSPKASLAWQISDRWSLTGSWGEAMRMPTVTELYQAITTGTALTVPNPNLKPEHADSYELAAERKTDSGMLRVTFFQENISNALLSQSAPLLPGSGTLFSFVQNIDRTRARGIELMADQYDAVMPGLELSGNLTAVDGRILRDSAFAPAVNKHIPQLPVLRANLLATYRPDDLWAFTLGARTSDRAFGTIDNSDSVSQTYQGFAGYLVFDIRARYRVDRNWTLSAGLDNINGDKYFVFHPFPQRTFVIEIHYAQ